jgi:hypothetical protein
VEPENELESLCEKDMADFKWLNLTEKERHVFKAAWLLGRLEGILFKTSILKGEKT